MPDNDGLVDLNEQCFICWEAKSDAAHTCPKHFTCQTCFEKELVPRTLYRQRRTSIHCSFPGCCFDYSARLSRSAKEQLQRNRTATKPRKFCPKCTSQDAGGSLELGAFDKQTENRLVLDCKQCKSHFCLFCQEEIGPLSHRLAYWFGKFGIGHVCKEESMQQLASYVRNRSNHCKPCPHCLALVHRTSGCAHMVCRAESGGCGNHFCFDCLSPEMKHDCANGESRLMSRFKWYGRKFWDKMVDVTYGFRKMVGGIAYMLGRGLRLLLWPCASAMDRMEKKRCQAHFASKRVDCALVECGIHLFAPEQAQQDLATQFALECQREANGAQPENVGRWNNAHTCYCSYRAYENGLALVTVHQHAQHEHQQEEALCSFQNADRAHILYANDLPDANLQVVRQLCSSLVKQAKELL